MANSNPPKKNQAFTTRIGLSDYSASGVYKVNPTIAAGDFKVDIDGAGFNNLTNLPTVSPAGSRMVLLSLTAAEMNGDVISIQCVDQTSPPEWSEFILVINTTP